MKTFANAFINEFLKSFGYKKALIISGFILSFLSFIILIIKLNPKLLNFGATFVMETNPYIGFYYTVFFLFSLFFLILLNFLVFFLFDVEEQNNTWKYINTLPVEKWIFWVIKLSIGVLFSFFILLVGLIFTYISTFLLPYLINSINFPLFELKFNIIIRLFSKLFIVSIIVIAFHLILSYLIKKKAVLYLISFFLPFISIYNFMWFVPYSLPSQLFFFENSHKALTGDFPSLITWFEGISLILTIGLILVVRFIYQNLNYN